ncbi:hypothetical protein BDP27DRAFT_1325926 [Rhodocollybia butyracea]|uniref:BZIP domain-containing protein n=1 Tax=Rhodocollybia butyracea TaxID=206335 RepID=A0A9P5PV37_9AGAR|nr:hypothetical protein BDP27DRAFT_1325926 [Rhodocollybia butyracea]
MSQEVIKRKKKNADAQAAFRARRNNYIATLEETVNNLESVVKVLQDSCKEAQTEAQELGQENIRLRSALRDRENFWRALWPKRAGSDADSSEFPTYPSPPATAFQYAESNIPLNQYPASPSVSYSNQQYSWPQSSSHSSNSPHFAESPTLASSSDINFMRYQEDQKVPMNNLESVAPYVFPASRSISPSSTPPSSSTTSLTSPFPFAFNDTLAVQDRPDFDYRRQSAEVTLHGGTADISSLTSSSGGSDGGVRYRINARDRSALLPLLPPIGTAGSDNGSQHGSQHGSDGGDCSLTYPHSNQNRLRPRRTAVAEPTSRSPSPDNSTPLSGTLAVIKAQAFGALRRTRVRNKKPDGPAKVSRDVLEYRGIVPTDSAVPAKRRRLNDDEDFDAPS